ncbi:hypothetical protein ACHWQZ_G001079 [Mnemiopsis leidyi]
MEDLPVGFVAILNAATLKQKQLMLSAISASFAKPEPCVQSKPANAPVKIEDLVEHVPDLGLDDDLYYFINEELLSLQLQNVRGAGVKTKWLSPESESYNYGKVNNKPSDIKQFPNILKLMDLVNKHPSTTGDMDCCLISRYPTHKSTLRWHSDNESEIISQSSSICTVSFGAPRQLQCALGSHNDKSKIKPDLVLPAIDRTMNVMKPGAQQLMLHAVSPGKESTDRSADVRFSISFRRHSPVDPKNQGPDELSSSDAQGQSSGSNKFADVVLIAGDSFAARLDQKLLGKGKKNVRNISKGGRKIEAVEKDIEDFVTANPQVGISKLFVSVGTNDMRNCQTGVKHLKKALSDLMHKIKLILPNTKIWFQSIPPINPNGSKFIARHVLLMNNLIFDMCSKFRLYYLDIFPVFLNWNGSINSRLFPPYDNVRKCFDIHPNKKDHRAISFDIEIEVKYKSCPKRKVFNYDKGDYRGLNEDLNRINWDRAFMSNDPCLAWDIFKKTLGELCDHRIPKKTMRSQFQPPWYDSECDSIRRKKEKWRIKAKESTNESDRLTYTEKFRSMRKLFKKTMNDKMKSNFVDDSDPALISKRFWTHVKSKSKSTRIPETVQYRNRFRYEAKDQAALFNEYFYNQFSEASNYNIDIDFANNDFLDLKFYSEDILLILRSLNPSKAAGPDGIHGKVLKYCASSLAYPLSILFNLSFVTGCIPPDWKLASVVPVFKKGDKGSVENYRPISLTSLVMKVFERCIKTALFSVCEDVLDPRQHGFLNNRSCVTQMVPFVHDLATNLNNKIRTDIIYFDFAKAFDSVSHDLILRKLKEEFKVDGLMLRFIKSYLEGREQQVVTGGQTSSKLPVHSGVPQGSILGPLLFVLFINDMFACISGETDIALYADDTKIWRRITMFSDHHILQNDINNLFVWSVNNKMVFHPNKCKALSISKFRNEFDMFPFNVFIYEINGTCIDYVNSQRDLGVELNNNLNWGSHHSLLVLQASSRLGLLRRTCHFNADVRQKRAFYLAIVRSLFEHCSPVWSPQYVSHLSKFENVQRRAVKWINGVPFCSYSDEKYAEELRKLKILPMKLKFLSNDLILFYKIVNQMVPIKLPSCIVIMRPTEGSRLTRQSAAVLDETDVTRYSFLTVPTTDTLNKSFFFRTVRNWNSIPVSVRQINSFSLFKSALMNYLWSPDTVWPD